MVFSIEGPLAVLFALEICARSEVLRAMTRDDISQVLVAAWRPLCLVAAVALCC